MHASSHQTLAALCLGALLLTAVPLASVHALGTETAIALRPHCIGGYEHDNELLSADPQSSNVQCPIFPVEDPLTQATPLLQVGDILDLDIVVENPTGASIRRVRAWLSYDPNVLQGDRIEVSEDFPAVTPGEADFSVAQGYAMVEASVEGRSAPKDLQIFVARVQFTVLKTSPSGTVIGFYDVQRGGHTSVAMGQGDSEQHLLEREPGVLHVVFTADAASSSSTPALPSSPGTAPTPSTGTSVSPPPAPTDLLEDGEVCITHTQCSRGACVAGICQAAGALVVDGGVCGTDAQCRSGRCSNNTCLPSAIATPSSLAPPSSAAPVEHGGSCTENRNCRSNFCAEGICIPSLDEQRALGQGGAASSLPALGERTAFALLQVQNVRVTTEDSSVYLGWDTLNSSQLKGYNIYYGTTTGRYIQRKTVESSISSLAIHSLPTGTTYYFAVRAVSTGDEESAFSQEVGVTVGDPKTSTAPLAASAVSRGGVTGTNPVADRTGTVRVMPGETGVPSTIAILLLLSAVIGTGFASRRQIAVATTMPS
jgi:hypothetical protein